MNSVQASIELIVDFHVHDTSKLAALTASQRQSFIAASAGALHGGQLLPFIELLQSDACNPWLTCEGDTRHPGFDVIRDAIVYAVDEYNKRKFGLAFDSGKLKKKIEEILLALAPEDARTLAAARVADPKPYSCIRWVWRKGEWVAIYNFDLVLTGGRAPTYAGLTAQYHVALSYVRGIVEIGN